MIERVFAYFDMVGVKNGNKQVFRILIVSPQITETTKYMKSQPVLLNSRFERGKSLERIEA